MHITTNDCLLPPLLVTTTQDLLPHLPNFTEIELFQEEICQTLQHCGDSIQLLKNQMRELADNADSTVAVSSGGVDGVICGVYCLFVTYQREMELQVMIK